MNTGKKVVLGSLAGFAIGAIAGILFAPEKGSTTRKQIKDKGNDYLDKLKSMSLEFSDSLKEKFESTQKSAENLANKGKENYKDAVKDLQNDTANFKHDGAPKRY